MSDRFRRAFSGAVKRHEERQWVYGLLGRKNPDGSFTFSVPGRRGFVYVTLRNAAGAQTVVPARNDASVEHKANTGVRMKLEHNVYVIFGKAQRSDLVQTPEVPDYGLPDHPLDVHKDTSFGNKESRGDGYAVVWDEASGKFILAEGGAGEDGLSAYEIAVANGFVGSVSEWLESLVGEQGEPGPTGATGPAGATGATGPAGASSGIKFTFSTSTALGGEATGQVRFSNSTYANVTAIGFDHLNQDGANIKTWLMSLDDSTNDVKGTLTFVSRVNSTKFVIFLVTGIDGNPTPTSGNIVFVSYVVSNGTFTNNEEIAVQFSRAGDAADTSELDNLYVGLTGNQTVAGIKTFSSRPVVPGFDFPESKYHGFERRSATVAIATTYQDLIFLGSRMNLVFLYGDAGGGVYFCDLLMAITFGGTGATSVIGTYERSGPAARIYNTPGNYLQLRMASGLYSVQAMLIARIEDP